MSLPSGLTSLSDLFAGDRRFIIPNYQRAYAWKQGQLRDLVDDLSYEGAERHHFFGTILLRKVEEDKDGIEVVEIVDGQQRLTTVIILVNEIVRQMRNEKRKKDMVRQLKERYVQCNHYFKLSVVNDDQIFFQDHILGDEEYPDTPETPSQRKLKHARSFFRNDLESRDQRLLETLLKRVQRLEILVYAVNTRGDAALLFETTNDRGKPLSPVEKTKSFLMYHAQITSEHPDKDLNYIDQMFARVYREADFLSSNDFEKIEEDRAQRYHFILTEKWSDKSDYNDVITYLRRNLRALPGKHPKKTISYIRNYSKTLRDVFFTLKNIIREAKSCNSEVGRALNDIFQLGRPANFLQIIVAGWIKYEAQHCKKRDFLKLLKAIEIFSFRCFAIEGRRSNIAETAMYEVGRDIFNDAISVSDAAKKIIATSSKYVSSSDFNDSLRTRKFYGGVDSRDIKYLLMNYEEYLRVARQPKESVRLDRADIFSEKIEVEHIYPQHNRRSEKFNEQHVNRLGNLALASKPANSSMSDKPFRKKAKNYYADSIFRMQRDLAKIRKWDSAEIQKRENKIVHFALKNWAI